MKKGKYILLKIVANKNCGGDRIIMRSYGHGDIAQGKDEVWIDITCLPAGCGEYTFPARMLLKLKTGKDVEISFNDIGWESFEIPEIIETFEEPNNSSQKIGVIKKDDLLKLRID